LSKTEPRVLKNCSYI